MKRKKLDFTSKLLSAIFDDILPVTFDLAHAFFLSAGSSKRLAQLSRTREEKYHSSIQCLVRSGYLKRVNENQFLITPKAIIKNRITKIETSNWEKGDWKGVWHIVSYDIPEPKKRERGIFRSLIKRKGFIGIQNSVFIAPFADFKELALLRRDLGIEKYAAFFTAQSYETDDDSKLRKKFKLNLN